MYAGLAMTLDTTLTGPKKAEVGDSIKIYAKIENKGPGCLPQAKSTLTISFSKEVKQFRISKKRRIQKCSENQNGVTCTLLALGPGKTTSEVRLNVTVPSALEGKNLKVTTTITPKKDLKFMNSRELKAAERSLSVPIGEEEKKDDGGDYCLTMARLFGNCKYEKCTTKDIRHRWENYYYRVLLLSGVEDGKIFFFTKGDDKTNDATNKSFREYCGWCFYEGRWRECL